MTIKTYKVEYGESLEDEILIASIRDLPGFMVAGGTFDYINDEFYTTIINFFEERNLGLVEDYHLIMSDRDPNMIDSVEITLDDDHDIMESNKSGNKQAESKAARDLDRQILSESIRSTSEYIAQTIDKPARKTVQKSTRKKRK